MDIIKLSKKEIQFSIKGTNIILRVWKSKTIFYRLDKYNAYSVPFTKESFQYLLNENISNLISLTLKQILELGEFQINLDKEKELIKILTKLKIVFRKYEW